MNGEQVSHASAKCVKSVIQAVKHNHRLALSNRKNKFSSQKQQKTIVFWACGSPSAGRCAIGMSYDCEEMTRCSASGGAYGAIG